MLIEELSCLSIISKSLEAPAKPRKAQADTKKNREALFEACSNRSMDKLIEAIDTGMNINILNTRAYQGWRSPLGACASIGWTEGIAALLERGADESKIEDFFKQEKGSALNHSCLTVSVIANHPEAFRALHGAHTERQRAEAIDAITSPALYLACEALGVEASLSQERMRLIASQCMRSLDGSAPIDEEERRVDLLAFDSISKHLGWAADLPAREGLWLEAIREGSPGMLQGLAKRGIAPHSSGTIQVILSKFCPMNCSLKSWTEYTHEPQSWNKNFMRERFTLAAHEPIRVGLATAALMTGHYECSESAYALLALKPLRDEAMGTVLGRHILARKADNRSLRRLGSLGADLSCIVDDNGSNPLHRSAADSCAKAEMEELARLCVDWISQRDEAGRLPIELVDAERRPSMSTLFDLIGMRESLGGKRGKITVPAAKKRL